MYNETDIQRVKSNAAEYKRLSDKWSGRALTMLILLGIAVILDVIMIATPAVAWGWVLWMGALVTIAYLVSHIVCTIKTKRFHAKYLAAEAYIAKNDYTNINKEKN